MATIASSRSPDGRSRVAYRNPERIPYGPVDPEFMLLRVDDNAGRTRALIVQYAVHAVVLGQSNCKFSADYPGVMQAAVERELPGAQVMFVQGGAGDVNPLFLGRSEDEATDFGITHKMGETLAAEVLKANGKAVAVKAGPIRARSQMLEFRNRWDKDKNLSVGLTTILIGKDIAIATVPGETLSSPAKDVEGSSRSRVSAVLRLYLLERRDVGGLHSGPGSASRGGYGADVSTTIEVGAGERIIQQHLINLYDLQGMWHDTPGKQ